jgi:branched-chain amino acid transport system substrate-binding protein
MTGQGARASRIVVVAVAASALALSACGSSKSSSSSTTTASGGASSTTAQSTTGTSGSPYVIGEIGSTNSAAAGFEEWRKGVLAYFDTVNASGGVNGHPIQMNFKDDATFDTQNEVSYYNQLTQGHALAIMGLTLDSSIPVIAAKGEADGVPIILGSGAEHAVVSPVKQYEYGFTPDFRQHIQAMAGAASQTGVKKVAIIVIDSSESRDATAYAKQVLPSQYGITVVSAQYTPPTATDFSAQVQAAQQAGAQAILTIESPSSTILVAHAMQAQKYTVPVYGVEADTGVASSMATLGATYVAVAPEKIDSTTAGFQAASQAAQKYGFASVLSLAPGQFLNGWVAGQVVAKALSGCGSSCTSSKQLNTALGQVSGLDTGGLTPSLSLSASDHNLIGTEYSWQVKNGSQVAGTGVSTTP